MWRDSLKLTNILTTNKQELKEGKDGNHLMSTYTETSSMYVSKKIHCHQICIRLTKLCTGVCGFDNEISPHLKGQLIPKCPYEKSVLSKIPTEKFPRFLP